MNLLKPTLALTIQLFSSVLFGQKKENSLLWEISGNGLEQSSYLYGTVHMIDKKNFFVRPEIDSVFARSEQVAFEIDLDDTLQLMKIFSWMNLPEGETIENIAAPDQLNKIKTYFADSLGTDMMQFNDQKPFVLLQQLASHFIEGEQESFESYFILHAMEMQKPVIGLESIDDQFAIFDSIPYEEQIQWIINSIDSSVAYEQDWDQLVAAYRAEDLERLKTLLYEGSPELISHEDEFLIHRNKKWVTVIEKYAEERSTFIAVGAAHLIGENGLIQLLRIKGYTVSPIHSN